MRFWLSMFVGGILWLPSTAPAQEPSGWVLEFGPYSGHYDFDSVTSFQDRAMFGARAAVHLHRWAKVEAEFDEVYTERESTGNRARQIALALHARLEPEHWTISPALLVGMAYVGFDDEEDPDAFGEAFDVGLGVRGKLGSRWRLRAEWLLRRQEFRVYRRNEDQDAFEAQSDEPVTLWGRGFRLGVAYVF